MKSMKKIIKSFTFVASILLVVMTFFVSTVFASNNNRRSEKYVLIPKDDVIDRDFYINAGDIVEVSGTVNGDVIVAGGQVIVDGLINGDLIVAGGTVIFSGEVRDDVRIVGGQVTIGGKTGRNLSVIGGNIEVGQSSQVGGGALLAGGNVILSGEVNGDVVSGAGNFTLTGGVGNNVEIWSEMVSLTSSATIGGDMTYTSNEEMSVTKGASISGVVVRNTPPVDTDFDYRGSGESMKKVWASLRLTGKLVSFVSALIVGLFMVKLFPKYLEGVRIKISEQPLRSAGVGALLLFLSPLVMLLLFISVIGIPVGFIFLFAYITYIYISKIYVAYWLGDKLVKRLNLNFGTNASFFTGLLVIYVVTSVLWVIGGLLSFVILLVGLGAGTATCRMMYLEGRKNKII